MSLDADSGARTSGTEAFAKGLRVKRAKAQSVQQLGQTSIPSAWYTSVARSASSAHVGRSVGDFCSIDMTSEHSEALKMAVRKERDKNVDLDTRIVISLINFFFVTHWATRAESSEESPTTDRRCLCLLKRNTKSETEKQAQRNFSNFEPRNGGNRAMSV